MDDYESTDLEGAAYLAHEDGPIDVECFEPIILQDCANCLGTGSGDLLDEDTPCPVCDGTGLVEHDCG